MSIRLLDTPIDIPAFLRKWLLNRREREKHAASEWAQIEEQKKCRQLVVNEIRALMKEAYQKYTRATRYLHGGELETFQHYQSPRRILAIDPRFAIVAEKLRDQAVWDMLSRGERKFIADVCKFAKIS